MVERYRESDVGDDHVKTYPVILALTRPPTILGIPYLYVCAEGFIAVMAYLFLGSILWLPSTALVLHAFFYVACVKGDLWFFDILMKTSLCGVNPVGRRRGGGVKTVGA